MADNNEVSVPLIETAIKISTPDLARTLASERAFRRFTMGREVIGVEGRRTVARLTEVRLSSPQNDLVVNVFVNCPYLSPSTGFVDPHYAGTFSFFGGSGESGHDDHNRDFVIDITTAVRGLANEGRIRNDELTIQLMPLPAYMDRSTEATFRAGRVEIVAF
jgi:tyrosinase